MNKYLMKSCFVLYDNLIVDDEFYRERLLDITDFYIRTNLDRFSTTQITEQLGKCADQGYTWAFVNAIGHYVADSTCYQRAIDQCIAENSPLMCHILDRYVGGQGQYPEFDPQCFVINLELWSMLGRPQFEIKSGSYQISSQKFLRSWDNYHDNYTPYWICTGPDTTTYQGPYRGFGSLVLQSFIENNCKIINFDQNLRRIKSYLYPNKTSDHLIPFFKDGTINFDVDTNLELWPLAKIIKEDITNAVYVLNTEPIIASTPTCVREPLDHIVGVASGFKTVLLLKKLGFHENTQVTYVDISSPALDYQKYLIEHWNGDFEIYTHIIKNYQDLHPELNQETNFVWRVWNDWEQEIKDILEESNITQDEFYTLWNQYRTLDHHYMKIDLLDTTQHHRLINCIKDSKLTYIWLSNAFDMEYIRFYHGSKYSDYSYQHLMKSISDLDQRIFVETSLSITKIKIPDSTADFLKKFGTDFANYPQIPPNIQKNYTAKFDWILNESHIPYLKLDIDGPWDQMLKEVRQLDHLFVTHRSPDSFGWSSLCLHGISAQYTDSYTQYDEYKNLPADQIPYRWTEIADLCPITTDYFKNQFPFKQYHRLRFMRLAPNGFIAPHSDSTTWQPNAINISLNNPDGCNMVLGGAGYVPFKNTGSVILLNTSYTHAVWNCSNQPRYHMIAHGVWDGQLGQKIVESYEKKLK